MSDPRPGAHAPMDLLTIAQAVRKDAAMVVIFALACLVAGAAIGMMTRSVQSTAQLVIATYPLGDAALPQRGGVEYVRGRDAAGITQEKVVGSWRGEGRSELYDALPPDLDANTASLMCQGDEVMQRLFARLQRDGEMSAPPKTIALLRSALRFKMTLAIDTPYSVVYSPLLELSAKSKSPADAQALVNAWADECVTISQEYQSLYQQHGKADLERELSGLGERLGHAELTLERFYELSSPAFMRLQVAEATRAMAETLESKTAMIRQLGSGERSEENPALSRLQERAARQQIELSALQGALAQAEQEEARLRNLHERLQAAYNDLGNKVEYVTIASGLASPPLKILSQGAEWPMPRFRRAILFGGIAAAWGAVLALALSVGARVLLTPPAA